MPMSGRIKAAIHEDLGESTVRMLYSKGCPWNETDCTTAAFRNHLKCLLYLHTEGCPWDEDTLLAAVVNDSISCLQFALDSDCPGRKRNVMDTAALLGRINCMHLLQRAGTSWDSGTFDETNLQLRAFCTRRDVIFPTMRPRNRPFEAITRC